MTNPNKENDFLSFPVIFIHKLLFVPPICCVKILFVPNIVLSKHVPKNRMQTKNNIYMKKLLSIVIPVYKVEKFIDKLKHQ